MCLKWKDINLECKQSATDQQIQDLAWNMTGIDYIDPLHTTQTDLRSKAKLHDFLAKHYRLCHYMFSFKKCGLASCSVCNAPRLPEEVFNDLCHLPSDGEKYKSLNDVNKTNTTEEFRPSLKYLQIDNQMYLLMECPFPHHLHLHMPRMWKWLYYVVSVKTKSTLL